MAKPSVTNIKPPATPPQTIWNLTTTTSGLILNDAAHATAFNAAATSINYSGTEYACGEDETNSVVGDQSLLSFYQGYDYIFFATNGGYDEQVFGITGMKGILVTGDGKDAITAGDMGDLVFAGNGKDVVIGGAGEDIIYGENGVDTLSGNGGDDVVDGGNGDDVMSGGAGSDWLAGGNDNDNIDGGANDDVLMGDAGNDTLKGGTDDGSFQFTAAQEGQGPTGHWEVKPGKEMTVPDPDTAPGTFNDNQDQLKDVGAYIDGGTRYVVFSYEPEDPGAVGGAITIDVYGLDGVVETIEVDNKTFQENQKFYFAVEDGLYDHLVVKTAAGTQLDTFNWPNSHDWFTFVEDSPGSGQVPEVFSFTAGDVLCGDLGDDKFVYGNGDGVDEIHDFNFTTENDLLQITTTNTVELNVHDDPNTTGDDPTVYVLFKDSGGNYIDDAAIQLTGVSTIDTALQQHITVNGIALA
jgi:Ca2+-binding RTX toxin-like protein